jgi:hypothetical protein
VTFGSPGPRLKTAAFRALLSLVTALQVLLIAGCGGSSKPLAALDPGPLSIIPQKTSLTTGGTLQLSAHGIGSAAVTWSIDGGGSGNDWLGNVWGDRRAGAVG